MKIIISSNDNKISDLVYNVLHKKYKTFEEVKQLEGVYNCRVKRYEDFEEFEELDYMFNDILTIEEGN